MPDRFDDAKRALEGVPAHDVWAEAEHRAADGSVVPLTAPAARAPRRYGRWIAAAAVIALVGGTVAVIAGGDGGDGVKTGSSGPSSTEEEITTYQADGGCKVGITGAPLPEPTTIAFAPPSGEAGTMLTGHLNDAQQYALHVPGQVVIDLVGERTDEVQLRRGTATVWFQVIPNDSVQVRWFPGITEEEPCESFTVSVEGGTEDENRHAAVDLAERIVLASDLPGCCEQPSEPADDPLDTTDWQLEGATVDGEPTGGSGALFSFEGGRVTWSDLCNTFDGDYLIAEGVLRVGTTTGVTSSQQACPPNGTTDAIQALMTAARIAWTIDDRGFLILTAGDVELVLRPPVGDPEEAEDSSAGTTLAPSTTTTVVDEPASTTSTTP